MTWTPHYDDAPHTFEVHVGGRWESTVEYIWRTWTGARLLDGKAYQGPRYVLGTDTVSTSRRLIDLCCDCGDVFVEHDGTGDDDVTCAPCTQRRVDAMEGVGP